MIVIAGLGNPGPKYRDTKHNIGFMTVDLLAERHDIKIKKLKHMGYTGEGIIAGKKVMLVKPQTFMNESGRSIRAIVDYYGIAMEDLVVVYDDADIPLGTLRIRRKGSAGSHNGMRNIVYLLEDDGFPRFRIGIGGERGSVPLRDYVLTGFSEESIEEIRAAVLRCVDALELMLTDGIEGAMLKYNGSNKESAEESDENQSDGQGGT